MEPILNNLTLRKTPKGSRCERSAGECGNLLPEGHRRQPKKTVIPNILINNIK
jgi:hypothetical protein